MLPVPPPQYIYFPGLLSSGFCGFRGRRTVTHPSTNVVQTITIPSLNKDAITYSIGPALPFATGRKIPGIGGALIFPISIGVMLRNTA